MDCYSDFLLVKPHNRVNFANKTTLLRRNMKVNVEKKTRPNGCDCWGRTEYENYYVVKNENGEVIYITESDPTSLINYLCGR